MGEAMQRLLGPREIQRDQLPRWDVPRRPNPYAVHRPSQRGQTVHFALVDSLWSSCPGHPSCDMIPTSR